MSCAKHKMITTSSKPIQADIFVIVQNANEWPYFARWNAKFASKLKIFLLRLAIFFLQLALLLPLILQKFHRCQN